MHMYVGEKICACKIMETFCEPLVGEMVMKMRDDVHVQIGSDLSTF